jgi:RNA polymerase sigma factor (sigma-70 family)
MADNEEAIKVAIETQLAFIKKEAGITWQGKCEVNVVSEGIDSVYDRVIIEHKNPASSDKIPRRILPALRRSSSRSRSGFSTCGPARDTRAQAEHAVPAGRQVVQSGAFVSARLFVAMSAVEPAPQSPAPFIDHEAKAAEASEFGALIERVKRGDQDAAWRILELYGSHLQRYVRRSSHRDMRSKFDSIDFVQVCWASFFREPQRLQNITTPAELMSYLATLARNKVVSEVRRRINSQKRDVRREVSLHEVCDSDREALVGRDPTPSSVAICRERWEQLVAGQPTLTRKIVELRFEGATYEQIASELRINERTARRTIHRLIDDVEAPAPIPGTSSAEMPDA